MMLFGFIFGLCVGVLVLCVVMFVRNNRVYRYRIALIERIYEDRIASIYHQPNQGLSWELLRAVPYDSMLWQFWRPLDDFFLALPREGETT